ncbi:MAG: hypothetical protein ABIQ44_16065 [Chloroflexia bacterium]
MKTLLILVAVLALLLTTALAMSQPANGMPNIDNRGSMLDAMTLFAVALLAVAGGLLIRRRVS